MQINALPWFTTKTEVYPSMFIDHSQTSDGGIPIQFSR